MSLADADIPTGTADDHYWHGVHLLPDDHWGDPTLWDGFEQQAPPDTDRT